MDQNKKITLAIAAVIGIVVGLVLGVTLFKGSNGGFRSGAAGNQLLEQYSPVVQYNGGLNTALPAIFSGGITLSGATSQTGSFALGSSGTAQVNQVFTTCSMRADVSITASSTGYAFCTGVTGVTSADNVIAIFATSSLNFVQAKDGWEIISAKASSTAGAIDFVLANDSGATQAPSAGGRTGSSTSIFAGH